ncbi:MAG TPA: ArsA-related P-loop ATPase [Solirubrobacteraceae bacterium]|nr:ArsA-related P-loop ATPase [Solirubrobacteraceae bacterium]
MTSALDRKLVVVTGKGGVGKTTLATALALLAASRGLRTIVVEVTGAGTDAAAAGRLAALLGHPEPPPHGVELELGERLWGLSIDRDRVLAEWLRALGGRVPARVLTSSASFQYLLAAAPGAREMMSMVKVWELAEGRRPDGGEGRYDIVVLDAPATGHALGMLRAPKMFSAVARVGPIARQARQVQDLLGDPGRSAYIAVTQAGEMAVTETLELRASLRDELDRELDAVVVNGALPRRFSGADLNRIAPSAAMAAPASEIPAPAKIRGAVEIPTPGEIPAPTPSSHPVAHSARRAARAVHERVRLQQSQIARLRRGGVPVVTVPFAFQAELDLAALRRIAERLKRGGL